MQTPLQPHRPKITVGIKETLDNLTKNGLKSFQFYLKGYRGLRNESIPWGELEDKDAMDTTTLMIGHYGNEEALQVTMDILKQINQRELANQLEKKMGKTTNVNVDV